MYNLSINLEKKNANFFSKNNTDKKFSFYSEIYGKIIFLYFFLYISQFLKNLSTLIKRVNDINE